jgi:hypothetical protein
MWSNSSTPLKLAVGDHAMRGIHKSNFICSVRSTRVTDVTKGSKKEEEEEAKKNLTEAVLFFYIFII